MELKHPGGEGGRRRPAPLLIVPYGIETFKIKISTVIFLLLIVPYGIETVELPYG